MKLKNRIFAVILTMAIVLTGFGTETVMAAEAQSVFTVTQTKLKAESVASSRGYGVLKRTGKDGNTIRALIDSKGNYIFDFDSEYATWGGYSVMDDSVVKIGDTGHTLFYNMKTRKFFDAYEWADAYVMKIRPETTRTELYRCFAGNSTITVTLHFYHGNEYGEWFNDVDLVYDLSGNLVLEHWGEGHYEDASQDDFFCVGDDAAMYYTHYYGYYDYGTVVVDYSTGIKSWTHKVGFEWEKEIRRGNLCDMKSFNVWSFCNGYAVIRDNETSLFGYMDKLGDMAIEPQYEGVYGFDNGYAAVKKNGKWGYINKSNQLIIPFEYDQAYGGADGFFTVVKDGACGIVNKQNEVVLPIKYDDISAYAGNVAYAVKDGKVFIIRNEGKVVKAASTITLKEKTATYNGKAISIGKATVVGSTGTVTYTYYTDQACTKKTTKTKNGAAKDGAAPSKAGTYYVKAKVAADKKYSSKTSTPVKLTIQAKEKLALSETQVIMDKGTALSLKLNHATSDVTWSSSKKSVATVSSKGKITAVKEGTATITAISGGKKYTCKVTVTPVGTAAVKKVKNAKIGDVVKYGTYEQDNNSKNGKEDIEWIVLDKKDGKVLLLSKYILDAKQYHEGKEDTTWEDCTLRKWLNGEFYTTAFSKKERSYIAETLLINEGDPDENIVAEKNTRDKVFLLSNAEALSYFDSNREAYDPGRQTKPTTYAKEQGAWSNASVFFTGNGEWWLRSNCHSSWNRCVTVYADGSLSRSDAQSTRIGIRPAIWIEP